MAFSPKFMVLLMVFVTFMIMARSTAADTSPEKYEGVESCAGTACCIEAAHGVCVDNSGCCPVPVTRCCRIPGSTIITNHGQKWRNYCCHPNARCAANQKKCIQPSTEGEWAGEMLTGETEDTPEVYIEEVV